MFKLVDPFRKLQLFPALFRTSFQAPCYQGKRYKADDDQYPEIEPEGFIKEWLHLKSERSRLTPVGILRPRLDLNLVGSPLKRDQVEEVILRFPPLVLQPVRVHHRSR